LKLVQKSYLIEDLFYFAMKTLCKTV